MKNICKTNATVSTACQGIGRGWIARIAGTKALCIWCRILVLCTGNAGAWESEVILQRMERSGLKNLVEQYTFDQFVDQEPFQKKLKAGALDFLRNHDRQWFFAGGQVGAGKTHLCTAIAVAFLKKGMGVRYMMWCDDSAKLKSVVNDCEEYERRIQPLKTIPVLYIDDFFKTSLDDRGSKKMPTQADVRLAFEILNYRYNNNCITILSSEWTVDEILHCDEAVGSRIYQRTKEHCFVIGQDRRKNYRLKQGVCP